MLVSMYAWTIVSGPNLATHTQPFNGRWSGTNRVGRYQKKHSPTHTHPVHRTSFINFLYFLRSMASSVFSLRAWQSSLTTTLQVLFGLPLGLGPSASNCICSPSRYLLFCSTRLYQRSLFCCNTNAMSSILVSLSAPYLGICLLADHPPDHSHPDIFFPYRPGLTSTQHAASHTTTVAYNLPLIIKDTSLLASSGTSCLNLFQPIRLLASTAESASPSTLSMSPR